MIEKEWIGNQYTALMSIPDEERLDAFKGILTDACHKNNEYNNWLNWETYAYYESISRDQDELKMRLDKFNEFMIDGDAKADPRSNFSSWLRKEFENSFNKITLTGFHRSILRRQIHLIDWDAVTEQLYLNVEKTSILSDKKQS